MERLTEPNIKDGNKTICKVIDARAVREHAMELYWALKKYEDTGITADEIERLRNERPRGKWNRTTSDYECSRCQYPMDYITPYCPNCGADMRGGKDD